MADPVIVFRTTGDPRWTGVGRNLTAAEGDSNIWELLQAILDLNTSRPQPDEIVSVTQNGARFVFNLESGATLPELILPTLQFKWRNFWLPTTNYAILDTFRVEGRGIYSTLLPHISAATFDENAVDEDDAPLYNKIWASGSDAQSAIYDIGFYYGGVLADHPATLAYVYQEIALRPMRLLSAPADRHVVYMTEAPSSADQVMTLFINETNIGTVTVPIGQNAGTMVITADQDIVKFDRLSVSKPATADATAAGLTVGFAMELIF